MKYFCWIIISIIALHPETALSQANNSEQNASPKSKQTSLRTLKTVKFLTVPKENDAFAAELYSLAKIASILVDGDECCRIVSPRAELWMFKSHPEDEWFGADNYDVNQDEFIRVKKLLIRMAKLRDFPVDCNLWMLTRDQPDQIHAVIRNLYGFSNFYQFGQQYRDIPMEFAHTIQSGEIVLTVRFGNMVSAIAPVRDSLQKIFGVIEVAALRHYDPKQIQGY